MIVYTAGDSNRRLNTVDGYIPKKNGHARDLLAALVEYPNGEWIPSRKIMMMGIGCYGNVIGDLRDLGWSIVCRQEHKRSKGKNVVKSAYALYRKVHYECLLYVQPRDCGHKMGDNHWAPFRR